MRAHSRFLSKGSRVFGDLCTRGRSLWNRSRRAMWKPASRQRAVVKGWVSPGEEERRGEPEGKRWQDSVTDRMWR